MFESILIYKLDLTHKKKGLAENQQILWTYNISHPSTFGHSCYWMYFQWVTWQCKYWLKIRTQENIYFLRPKAFSWLQALKTSNLFEEGSHSPQRFPLAEVLDFSDYSPLMHGDVHDSILQTHIGIQLLEQKSKKYCMCKLTTLFVVI